MEIELTEQKNQYIKDKLAKKTDYISKYTLKRIQELERMLLIGLYDVNGNELKIGDSIELLIDLIKPFSKGSIHKIVKHPAYGRECIIMKPIAYMIEDIQGRNIKKVL